MPTFKLDGKEIPFEPGESIIKAAFKRGIEIPHYCWHPGLSSPANCRMCLVEIKPAEGQPKVMLEVVEWDETQKVYRGVKKPKLFPACQMPAVANQEVFSEQSVHVKQARSYVQEALLLNHPVDCPICDQAGECKLQDYWLDHHAGKKRMHDEPIHKPKGVSFGDTIVYDGERCIMCTRCIRFMDEVAKNPVLGMRERGNLNEVFVAPGRKLDGNYTFMLDHVCPVGALTTKDFRFKARVWFLRAIKVICQGCATGCNSYLDYDPRNGVAYRLRPRDNEAVNRFWMCDEGMLSYHKINEGKLKQAKIMGAPVENPEALLEVKKRFYGVSPSQLAFVFSFKHSLEDNWALREIAMLMGGGNWFTAGGAPGFQDDILIHADKNSNSRGVMELVTEAKPFVDLMHAITHGGITHVIALGSDAFVDGLAGDADVERELRSVCLVTLASSEGPMAKAAHVLFPVASWAEGSGVYVNAKGIAQISEPMWPSKNGLKSAWKVLAEIGREWGFLAPWASLKDVRKSLHPSLHSAPYSVPSSSSSFSTESVEDGVGEESRKTPAVLFRTRSGRPPPSSRTSE